jgi:hypothetical protein
MLWWTQIPEFVIDILVIKLHPCDFLIQIHHMVGLSFLFLLLFFF